jgi:hypothetical protein
MNATKRTAVWAAAMLTLAGSACTQTTYTVNETRLQSLDAKLLSPDHSPVEVSISPDGRHDDTLQYLAVKAGSLYRVEYVPK